MSVLIKKPEVIIKETSTAEEFQSNDPKTLKVILEPDEEGKGYTVSVDELPGLITEGDTINNCIENFTDALSEYIRSYIKAGETLPIDLTHVEFEFEIGE